MRKLVIATGTKKKQKNSEHKGQPNSQGLKVRRPWSRGNLKSEGANGYEIPQPSSVFCICVPCSGVLYCIVVKLLFPILFLSCSFGGEYLDMDREQDNIVPKVKQICTWEVVVV